jgi:hypothetical protein
MQERTFTGRIASLVIFRVPEFGTRAKFTIEDVGQDPVVCAAEGDVAREFIARYCGGDNVTVRGVYEPRPSTAAKGAPWVPRYRVRAVQVAEDTRLRHDAGPYPRDRDPGAVADWRSAANCATRFQGSSGSRCKSAAGRDYRFPVDRHAVHRCFRQAVNNATVQKANIETVEYQRQQAPKQAETAE